MISFCGQTWDGVSVPQMVSPDWPTSPRGYDYKRISGMASGHSEKLLPSLLSIFFLLLRTGSPQLTFCSRGNINDIQRLTGKYLIGSVMLKVSSWSCLVSMAHTPTLSAYGHLQGKPTGLLGSSSMNLSHGNI